MCRDTVASTTATTTLSADNVVDTYAGADGTLNTTSASTAALAILACKVTFSPTWQLLAPVEPGNSVIAHAGAI